MSWTEIDRSDQDRTVILEVPAYYFFGRYSLDFLTVLLKNAFQVGRVEGVERSREFFKSRTGDGTPNSTIHIISRELDGLTKGGPKEKISELKLTGGTCRYDQDRSAWLFYQNLIVHPAFPRERHGPGRVPPNPPFATAGTVPFNAQIIMPQDSRRFRAET